MIALVGAISLLGGDAINNSAIWCHISTVALNATITIKFDV